MQNTHDVVVVGSGIMGLCAAAECLSRGLRVAVIERFDRLLHNRGSSRGESRTYRPPYENPVYGPWMGPARDAWRSYAKSFGRSPWLIECGGLEFGDTAAEGFRALPEQLRSAGVPYQPLPRAELRRRYPALGTLGNGQCLFRPDAGIMRAGAVMEELASYVSGSELATVLSSSRVVEIAPGSDTVTVWFEGPDRRRVVADRVVLAAGAELPELLRSLGMDVPSKKTEEQYTFFSVDGAEAALPVPATYQADLPSGGYYLAPDLGTGVKVGERVGGPDVTATGPTGEIRPDTEDRCEAVLRQLLPALVVRKTRSETCVYEWSTADYRPVVGPIPSSPKRVWACGLFTGGGFKFGPLAGQLVFDWLAGNEPRVDLTPFDPRRFQQ